jgi:hypothetical protein
MVPVLANRPSPELEMKTLRKLRPRHDQHDQHDRARWKNAGGSRKLRLPRNCGEVLEWPNRAAC